MMRHSIKRHTLAAVLSAAAALSMCMPAYAASKDTIPSVKLEVDCGEEPEAGDSVGSVEVKIPASAKYEISEEAEYYDTNDDEWERGEVPVIRVELRVKDFEKDRFTSSTKVTVSRFHSSVKSKKVLDNGETLRVDIKLRAVGGELEEVDDYWWDGRYAAWSDIDDADKYEVKLYRGSNNVATVTTTSNRYNFYPYMTRSGNYTFKVRGISNSDGEKGTWSGESDEYYISEGDVYRGTPPSDSSSSGSGSPSSNSGSPASGWAQDQNGWTYRLGDGNLARNTWIFVDNNWFYLGGNAYMLTDWIFVDNNWFYLNPVSDGTKGAMKTGWLNLGGTYYYLNPISDGTRGARMTSYQNIDGKWYFFDLSTGALWMNRATPNGKWADANGVIN